ncbi:MAG: hypothetical protein QM499_05495 [Flavobacteriaceae bacterium]
MKLNYKIIYIIVPLFISFISSAQVGIGTLKPEGMLDLQNNNLTGFVFPKAILTATNIESPINNPSGGGLVAGTVVFNTNTTSTGTNDVYPGIYVWDGSIWIPQYLREDADIFEQSTLNFRVNGSDSYVDVPGLGIGTSFTPIYSGTYRIKANFNFGAGTVKDTQIIDMATEEGYFRFTFNGTSYLIYTHAYSIHNDNIGGGTLYEKFRHDSSLVLYVTLTSGVTYNFRLEIDMFVSGDFFDNGNSGVGRSWVGIDLPCTVEFTYLEE